MAYKLLYVPPWAMMSLRGTGGGTVATGYNTNWLVDGLPNIPVRGASANPSWSASGTSRACNFAAIINSNASAGTTATISELGIVVTQPASPGRVPFNPWNATALLATSTIGTATFAFSGNSVNPLIVGQLVCGQAFELERPIQPGGRRVYQPINTRPDPTQLGQQRVYRRDKQARMFSGTTVLTSTGMDAVVDWYESTEDGDLISIIVPDPLLNDAWAVVFDDFSYEKQGPEIYNVTLNFREVPRKRWP